MTSRSVPAAVRSSARSLAPMWLRNAVRPVPGPLPVERSVRDVIAVTTPAAVGAVLGVLSTTTLISVGAIIGSAVDRDVPYRQRALRVVGAVLAGTTGWMIGRAVQQAGSAVAVVAVVTIVAAFSAVISAAGPVTSVAALQLLVMTTVSSGRSFPGPFWVPGLLYLAGGLWSCALSLVFAIGRRTVPERRATAQAFHALADQLDVVGGDREVGEVRRQAVTVALSGAYDALLWARVGRGGHDRTFRRLFALLNAATLVSEAATAVMRASARPPEVVIEALHGVASAVERRRMPPDLPRWTSGPTVDRHLEDALASLEGVLAGDDLALGDGWTPTSWRDRLRRVGEVLSPGPDGRRAAVRLALCMAVAEVVSHVDVTERSYWVPLTAAVVLKPDLGSVLARGVQRGLGTVIGVVLGGLVIEFVPIGPWMLPFIALFAAMIPIGQSRNFGMFATFLTPLVLVLIDLAARVGRPLVLDRAIDSVVGVAIVLVLGYVIWPESWHARLGERVATAVEGIGDYLRETLDATPGSRALARRRVYRRLAELRTSFDQIMSEPGAVARRAAAWWPVVVGLERTTDAITSSGLVDGDRQARRDRADGVLAIIDDLAAAVRQRRAPVELPLPGNGVLADVAAELSTVRAALGGPDHAESGPIGRVVGEDGAAVAGVRVTVTDAGGHQLERMTTGTDGTYPISITDAGARLFVHAAPGYQPAAVWRRGAVSDIGTVVLTRGAAPGDGAGVRRGPDARLSKRS